MTSTAELKRAAVAIEIAKIEFRNLNDVKIFAKFVLDQYYADSPTIDPEVLPSRDYTKVSSKALEIVHAMFKPGDIPNQPGNAFAQYKLDAMTDDLFDTDYVFEWKQKS